MSLLDSIQAIFRDPPPEYTFEVSASGLAMSRTRPPAAVQFAPLAPGVLSPSPVRENIANVPAFTEALRKLIPATGGRRTAALILPDNAMRLAVLEFENLPEKDEERTALIRFRLRKTVPFDIDSAALSYQTQPGNKVLVAVAAAGVIAQYEAPFRALGLEPGIVTPAALAILELLPATGSWLMAHRNSGALSVLVMGNGILTLARSLELAEDAGDPIDEIASDLYATRVYIEDQAGTKPESLYLAGFGDTADRVATRLGSELDVRTEVLRDHHPGLAGYLRSVSARKVAA